MAVSSLIVLYDACVLYPAALRDLLIRMAVAGLCQVRWSDEILDEAFDNLKRARPDLDPAKLDRTRRRMHEAVPDALVTGHLHLVDSLELPDPSDRHVLAAAIHAGAEVVVTDNLRDFPEECLRPYGIRAWSADDFVLRLAAMMPRRIAMIVEQQAADLTRPPCSAEQLLGQLISNGLVRSVEKLRPQIDPGSKPS